MIVDILKLDSFGRGICYIDGKICFVSNAFINEKVEIEITYQSSKYLLGRVIRYIERSPFRIESICPYSNLCGGCCFMEYDYNLENQYKEEKIKDLVSRKLKLSSDVVLPIIFDYEIAYRNKILLHGDSNQIGLYENKSDLVVPIENCSLVVPCIQKILPSITSLKDTDEVMIRSSNDQKEIMISIKGRGDYSFLKELCATLIVNDKVLSGNGSIHTMIGNKTYQISSNSFFQVNTKLTNKMFDLVYSIVSKYSISSLLDLYCGTGTFGIYLADLCDRVIGIDYNPSNIEDAKKNAQMNHVSNIQFICDKVENQISSFQDIDCILVDPARNGLDIKTREYIKKISSKHLIYVSCNPDTLFRDLEDLKGLYDIQSIQPINFFPRTYHCESITVLERR